MAKEPYFQFYYSDWLGSTRRAMMTPAQRGGYIDLLCHQWADPTCSLPDDRETLGALSGLGEGWLANGSQVLRDCFPPHPSLSGRVANPRLLSIKADREEWVEKSRLGGIKSGESRRKSNQTRTKGATKREPNPQPNTNTPSPLPSPLPSASSDPSPKEETSPDGDGVPSKSPYSKAFEEWWAVYPRKVGKGAAAKKWQAVVQGGKISRDRLLKNTKAFAVSYKGQSGQFCPHPATWLNESRYDDDPKEWEEKGNTSGPNQGPMGVSGRIH